MIDITMTASSRPKLIEKVFISLKKYMPIIEFRLIINIAKAGIGCNQYDVLDVVKRYFSNFIVRVQYDSNQTDGLFWAWKNAQSRLVFNWEDDWELLQHIDLKKLSSYFDRYSTLASILLAREDKSNEGFSSNLLDNNLYERHGYIAGPPALIRYQFIREALCYMKADEHWNQTIKWPRVKELLHRWKFGVYVPDNLACVRDLGTVWKQENGIKSGRTIKEGTIWLMKT
ncbi:unnamed protein product [marine sediment metagenome]|uniref:Glycosyltransferase 2-like domain-containing protein n=1 Tax=marine sediment metagenome TaxID=412755 RepID=X0U1I3_9ZZZZ